MPRLTTLLLMLCLLAALCFSACNRGGSDNQTSAGDGNQPAAGTDTAVEEHSGNEVSGQPGDETAAVEAPRPGIADFHFRDSTDTMHSVSQFEGEALVICFWRASAETGPEGLKGVLEAHAQAPGDYRLLCIAVTEEPAEGEQAVDSAAMWQELGTDVELYHDVDGREILGIDRFPTVFFVKADGSMAGYSSRAMSAADFQNRVGTVLK